MVVIFSSLFTLACRDAEVGALILRVDVGEGEANDGSGVSGAGQWGLPKKLRGRGRAGPVGGGDTVAGA